MRRTAAATMPRPTKWRMAGALAVGGGILIVAALELSIQTYAEICQQNPQTGQEDCTIYSFPLFLAIKAGKILNDYGVGINALATIAIAAFTLTLWRSTEKLWAVEKIHADAAMQAADAAHKAALLSGRQADITDKQHGLARLQYLATHRPYFRIRSVSIESIGARPAIVCQREGNQGEFGRC